MIYTEIKGQFACAHYDPVIADSIHFLSVKFVFDKEWDGYTVTAIYHNREKDKAVSVVLDDESGYSVGDGTFYVPFDVIFAPGFTVSLLGTKGESRITTNEVAISVQKSGFREAEAPGNPTPTEYEQILQIATAAKDIAYSVREDADNDVFKGDKGDKGDTGEPFTYSDFTEQQLSSLKGQKGDKGDKGDKGEKGDIGEPFTYDDFTEEQLFALKGEKGDTGYTPVKNVDYWTDEDIAEIKSYVDEAILGGEW